MKLDPKSVVELQTSIGLARSESNLRDFVLRQNACCVGSGGSFAVAHAVEQIMASVGIEASRATPHEYMFSYGRGTLLVICSSKASHPELIRCAELAESRKSRILLITNSVGSPVEEWLTENGQNFQVIRCQPVAADGFISRRSTLSLLSGALSAFITPCSLRRLRSVFVQAVADHRKARWADRNSSFSAIGQGYGLAAVTDFESRCTESGIPILSAGDFGMFGHGRFFLTEKMGAQLTAVLFGSTEVFSKARWVKDSLEKHSSTFSVCSPLNSQYQLLYFFARSILTVDHIVAKMGTLLPDNTSKWAKPFYDSGSSLL